MYFELAWTLLSETKYHEAGEAFLAITKLNSWWTLFSFYGGCVTDGVKHAQEPWNILFHCRWLLPCGWKY